MKSRRLIKDKKKRNLYNKTELFQKVLKILFLYNKDSFNYLKLVIKNFIYIKIIKNMYCSQIKNYCVISGRSRAIYKKLKISRIILKNLGSEGLFFGLKKGS